MKHRAGTWVAVGTALFLLGGATGHTLGRLSAEPALVVDPPDPALAAERAALVRAVAAEELADDVQEILDAQPDFTLRVDHDGCGVIRPDHVVTPQNLTWVIKDGDGSTVLQRDAMGETRYRHVERGTFTVELVAWDGFTDSPVSDTVTVTC